MTNEVIKAMIERRSCRKFKAEQIKDEELQAILEAGKYAATGKGLQSPKMVVIQNPEVIAKYAGTVAVECFGTVILVLADATRTTAVQDGSLVMGNLMLAAHSIGVASCWINRAKEEFATEEGKALLKQWGIEGDYIGVGHCVLGYPAVDLPKPAPRKDDYVVFVK